MPAVALLSGLVFTYQGLWAGPWLRDVGGLEDGARAGVLLFYALGMMTGHLAAGSWPPRRSARRSTRCWCPSAASAPMAAMQAVLIAAAAATRRCCRCCGSASPAVGSAGPVAYAVLAQRFPPELTGRVATAMNGSMLALVFVLQNVIGFILDLWPRTAAGGWDPAGLFLGAGLDPGRPGADRGLAAGWRPRAAPGWTTARGRQPWRWT